MNDTSDLAQIAGVLSNYVIPLYALNNYGTPEVVSTATLVRDHGEFYLVTRDMLQIMFQMKILLLSQRSTGH